MSACVLANLTNLQRNRLGMLSTVLTLWSFTLTYSANWQLHWSTEAYVACTGRSNVKRKALWLIKGPNKGAQDAIPNEAEYSLLLHICKWHKVAFFNVKKSIGYVSSIACRYLYDITISLGGVFFALKEINTLTFRSVSLINILNYWC